MTMCAFCQCFYYDDIFILDNYNYLQLLFTNYISSNLDCIIKYVV